MDTESLAELSDLSLLPLRIRARAVDRIELPENWGSTVRGAFGGELRRLVCVHPERKECPGCPMLEDCAYPALFEPRAPEGAAGTSGFRDLPRAYVFRTPGRGVGITPGMPFTWDATLIGRAADYLPYFALTWKAMGEAGLGRGRGRFVLEALESLDEHGERAADVYEAAGGLLALPTERVDGRTAREWATRRAHATEMRLTFYTPTALTSGGRSAPRPDFPLLWRAVQLRLSLLRMAHGTGRPAVDFGGSIRAAEAVELVGWDSEARHWERVSRRQGRRVPMAGFVGEAMYRAAPGVLAPFLPALKLGEWVGIGDNCTFGQGGYQVGIEGMAP